MNGTQEQFNETYPIGTPVFYRPAAAIAAGIVTKTRSEAWTLGHGAVVVMVEGRSGGMSVDHLDLIMSE